MLKKFKKIHPSFTLIELLVAVSLFSIVVVVGFATVVILTKTRAKSGSSVSLQQAGKQAMEIIANDIQTQGSSADSINFNSTTYKLSVKNTNINNLTRTYELYNSAGTVGSSTCSSGPCYIGFYTTSTGVQRLTPPDISVTNLTFSGSAGSSTIKAYVTINMVLKTTWQGTDAETMTLQTTVVPMRTTIMPFK